VRTVTTVLSMAADGSGARRGSREGDLPPGPPEWLP